MKELLFWGGNSCAVAGLLACVISGLVRVSGSYTVGSMDAGTVFMLGIGLMRGQSYLKYVMEEMMPLQDEGWMILTRRLAWFFIAMAVANEIIWRNFSTDVYVIWDTFGQAGSMFAFFMSQYRLFEAHQADPAE